MTRTFIIPASNGDSIHSTTQIRLLSPLKLVGHEYQRLELSHLGTLQSDDIVLIDRYGDLDLDEDSFYKILDGLKASKARIIFFIDDDLFVESTKISQKIVSRVSGFISISEKVVTTTLAQQKKVYALGKPVVQIPIHVEYPARNFLEKPVTPKEEISIGYMGTYTHLDDLYSWTSRILDLHRLSPWKINLEIVGGGGSDELTQFSKITGAKLIHPPALSHDDFKVWMQENFNWDFGFAPLRHKDFNLYKSDIKVLDYAALGAIPVVESLEPYENLITNKFGVITIEGLLEVITSLDIDEFMGNERVKLQDYVRVHRNFECQRSAWEEILVR